MSFKCDSSMYCISDVHVFNSTTGPSATSNSESWCGLNPKKTMRRGALMTLLKALNGPRRLFKYNTQSIITHQHLFNYETFRKLPFHKLHSHAYFYAFLVGASKEVKPDYNSDSFFFNTHELTEIVLQNFKESNCTI